MTSSSRMFVEFTTAAASRRKPVHIYYGFPTKTPSVGHSAVIFFWIFL